MSRWESGRGDSYTNVQFLDQYMDKIPEWVIRGKTIRQLIKELQSFEDQDLEVRISVDGGRSHRCISLVGKVDGKAVLKNCEDED